MKKIISIISLLIPLCVFSQEQFFIGENAELLIGKKMTLKEGQTYYSGFYKDKKLKKILYKKNNENDPNKLLGLEFLVTKAFQNSSPFNIGKDMILVLENEKTGTIYYAYDSKYSDLFNLNVIGGLKPPKGYLCKNLEVQKDNFSSKITTSTPTKYEYSLIKIEENNETIIYLRLQSYGSTLSINKIGLKIKFSDETVMTKPNEKIKYKNESGMKGWTYSSFVRLNNEDIQTLSTKTITYYSLYIYERKMNSTNAIELREYLKCMIE